MKVLTKKKLVEDLHLVRNTCLLGIFGLAGLFCILYGAYYAITDFSKNTLIGLAVMSICFGLPFCYFIFWRNVSKMFKRRKCLLNGEFIIVYDEVVDKETRYNSDSANDYLLELKKYSEASNKLLHVLHSDYKKCKKGTKCILILENSDKYPTFYNAEEWAIHDELRNNVVGIFDANRFKKRGIKG